MTALLPEMTVDGAERLSERISDRLDTIAENYVKVMPLIREAINRNVHAILGYASPGAYIKDHFGDALAKLGIEVRREFVRELSNAGMSTRAIAPVFSVSQKTIVQDRQATEVIPEVSPAPLDDIDRDVAEAEAALRPSVANPMTGEVLDDAVVTETHTVKIVTGLDGKEYKRSDPAAPRRGSLIDDARNAGWQLRKAAERLERIQEDDRFTKNKAEIVAALQPHLDFVNETISGLGITTNTNEEK